jgi:hypothetical protein
MKILVGLFAAILCADPVTVYLRYGTPAGGVRVIGVSTGSPIRLTTNESWNGLSVNDYWVTSNEDRFCTGLTGLFKVAAVTATTLDLKTTADVNVSGAGCGSWTEPDRNSINGKTRATNVTKFGLLDGAGGTTTRRLRCAVDPADPCLISVVDSVNTATVTVADGYTDELIPGTSRVGLWNVTGDVDLNGSFIVQTKNDAANTFTITTASVLDATYANSGMSLSKVAYSQNNWWAQMAGQVAAWTPSGTYNVDNGITGDSYMANPAAAALYWFTTGDPTYLPKARIALLQVEDVAFGATYCDELNVQCGATARSSVDYGRFSLHDAAMAVRILCAPLGSFVNVAGQCTTAEFTAWERKVFHNEDAGCTYPAVTAGGGAMSVSGTTATGASLSVLANGDLLFLNTTANEQNMRRVVSGGGTGTLTLNSSATFASSSNWGWAPRQTTSHCGLVEYMMHHPNSVLSYQGKYGPSAGTASYYWAFHNLQMTQYWSVFKVGLTFADISTDAKAFAQRAFAALYDGTLAFFMARGSSHMHGAAYGRDRSMNMMSEIAWTLKYQTDYPDIGLAKWTRTMMESAVYQASPNSAGDGNSLGNHGRFGILFGQAPIAMEIFSLGEIRTLPRMNPGTDEEKWYYNWLLRQSNNLDPTWLGQNSNRWSMWGVVGWNPNVVPADPPLTARVFTNDSYVDCASLGMKYCPPSNPNPSISWGASRTGFSLSNATHWLVSMMSALFIVDHDGRQLGDLRIQGGAVPNYGNCLVGDDLPDCDNGSNGDYATGTMSTMNIGVGKQYLGTAGEVSGYMDRSRVDAGNRYVTWRANMTGGITATGLTRAYVWFAHMLKASGAGIVFTVYDAAGSPAMPMKAYTHFTQNGQTISDGAGSATEGTTTCIGGLSGTDCPSRQVLSQSGSNGIIADYNFPSTGTLRVDAAGGTYTGGNGYTFRFTHGPTASATIMETVAAFRLANDLVTNTITCTVHAPTGWMGKECNGATFLAARGDVSPTSIPAFTTTGTGDILASGLAAGTYSLYKDLVETCASVVVGTDQTIFCPGVGAGSITVGAPGAGGPAGASSSRVGGGGRISGGGKIK